MPAFITRHVSVRAFTVFVLALVAVGASTAGAAKLLTGANIKNGSLTGADIKNGSVKFGDLSKGTQALILAGGKSGSNGSSGTNGTNGSNGGTGATGAAGAKGDTGAAGAAGAKGDTRAPGPKGADGANPGVPVKNAGTTLDTTPNAAAKQPNGTGDAAPGDEGFFFSGGANNTTATPSATIERGALHLHGGSDDRTPQGAPGTAKAYSNVAFPTLSALGYKFAKNKLGGTDQPSIHVSVLGATTGPSGDSKFGSGFTNFVYNPTYNGLGSTRDAMVDAFAPGNKWYSTGADQNNAKFGTPTTGTQASPISIQEFQMRNPGATIVRVSFDNGGSTQGPSAAGDTDFSVDNAIIGFGSTFTRYDFGS